MRSLAIDTICKECSVAILESGQVVDCIVESANNSHVSSIVILLELLLSRNGWQYKDCNFISVTTGPGSFTGVRVGVAAALAIECAAGVRLVGVSSFDAYDRALWDEGYNTGHIVVLSSSRNAFSVRECSEYSSRPGKNYCRGRVIEMTAAELKMSYCDNRIIGGYDCGKPGYIPLKRPMAEVCGLTGHDLVEGNLAEYPKCQYGDFMIVKSKSSSK